MTTPTAVAARFPSEYGQTPETTAELLDWDEVAERIAASPNYWLATTTDEGTPYLRPVDGVFVDATLAFGGSPETRWVRHLQRRPAASASLPDDDHAVIHRRHRGDGDRPRPAARRRGAGGPGRQVPAVLRR
ncbi:MAG: pyridoxamine 5'-phosphate oxidase family protein [Ilumatobacteraceae bacterium]